MAGLQDLLLHRAVALYVLEATTWGAREAGLRGQTLFLCRPLNLIWVMPA